MGAIQNSVNQVLGIGTAIAYGGKRLQDEKLQLALDERNLAKSDFEKTKSDLKEAEKNLSEEELQEIEEEGIQGLEDELNPEKELEYKNKYGNKGIIGKNKLAKEYEADKDKYEKNEAIIQRRKSYFTSGEYEREKAEQEKALQNYKNSILGDVEKNKQIREEAIKRAEQERQEQQKQMKQLKKTKTSLGALGDLPENLQDKILEGLKKEEVNKK